MAQKTTRTWAPSATTPNVKPPILPDIAKQNPEHLLEWMSEQTDSRNACLRWAIMRDLVTEQSTPLNFKTHRFLKDIYNDWTPEQVVRKAAQVGFSTMVILKTMWAARYRKLNVIYTLPTFGDVNEFVSAKVDTIIKNNPIIGSWLTEKNNTTQKKVRDNFIYYRGTFSAKTEAEKMQGGVGIMLTADLLCHDESDRSDQITMQQYESRLGNSKFKGRWFFSNPTTPFTLSQKLWEQSDQRHWFIQCSHCGQKQFLSWPESIDSQRGVYICKFCHQQISDESRSLGKWIRKFQDKSIAGYWINHLMCPWIPARKIIDDSQKDPMYFHNFVLGLPYVGTGIAVGENLILKNCTTEPKPKGRMMMGLDIGLTCHYVIGNHLGIVDFGTFTTDHWEEFDRLMETYDIELAVIDSKPDPTTPRAKVRQFPGRVWLTWFNREIKKTEFTKWDENTHSVVTDRSKSLGQLVDDLDKSVIRYFINPYALTVYISHFKTLHKVREKDKMGNEQELWTTDESAADHYLFATLYYRMAVLKRGYDRAVTGLHSFTENTTPPLQQNMLDMEKFIKENQQRAQGYGNLL